MTPFQQSSTDLTLTPAQLQVAESLACGISVTEAALSVSVHRSTVYYWLNNNPRFHAAVRHARELHLTATHDHFASLTAYAYDSLRCLLESP
ncbi:MAG: hypothetical protein ACREUU_16935, partial [Gammaproteobacteria bacterium]